MNAIWGGMILTDIIYGIVTGSVQEVSDAFLSSAGEAVTLCITMLGVMGLWMGLMELAKEEGLIRAISKRIQPLICFLFPDIPPEHPSVQYITMNFVANLLGLGWVATPAGLNAMESLADLEEERRNTEQDKITEKSKIEEKSKIAAKHKTVAKQHRRNAMPQGTASNEMCNFLILNISSLQLIPMTVIAYRAQYGSTNPAVIVGPGIVATAVSTAVAVVFCKLME
jgi:spore maturation protein A